MKKIHTLLLVILGITLFSCFKGDNDYVLYHKFPNKTWERFNILSFELPVEKMNKYDVVFFARLVPDYPFDVLDFNVVMTTPSGEERIKEYSMKIKDKMGRFLQPFQGDSCEYRINIKKEIKLSQGTLKIEIENLIPRLETTGILANGIRLHPLK